MDSRIEIFLANFRTRLVQMSPSDIQTHVDAVCKSLLEKNKNLASETSKHFHVIQNRSYHFHRLRDIAQSAKLLVKTDVLRFFDKYLLKESPSRRKLCVHIYGSNHHDKLVEHKALDDPWEHVVTDPEEFSRCECLFPLQPTISIAEHMMEIEKLEC